MGKFVQNNFSEAIKLFHEASNLDPKNAAIHYKLADCYSRIKLSGKAALAGQKAIQLDPSNKSYYLLLTDIYISQQYYEDAAKVYADMISNVKNVAVYNFNLASIYEELGRHELSKLSVYQTSGAKLSAKREKEIKERGIGYFRKALEAFNAYEKAVGVTEEISEHKQKIYLALGEIEKAILEGEKLINEHPNEMHFRIELAELLYKNNQKEPAMNILHEAANEFPNNPEPRLVLSEYYKRAGELEKSDEQLALTFDNPRMNVDEKVKLISTYLRYSYDETKILTAEKLAIRTVKTHPDQAQAHSILGDVYNVLKKPEDARKAYLDALHIDNSKFLIWQQVVGIDMDLGDHDSVVVHAEDALALFPNKAILWLYQGVSNMVLKKDSVAVKSLESGRALVPFDYALKNQFNANLGDAYNSISSYEASDSAYEAVLEYEPNNAHVLNNYSYFLSLRGEKLEEAKSMCERLILLHSNEATYLDTYAWVLYKSGEYKKAKKLLEQALLTTDDGTVMEHYGDVLYRLGMKDEAITHWIKAQTVGGASDKIDLKITDKQLYE